MRRGRKAALTRLPSHHRRQAAVRKIHRLLRLPNLADANMS